MTRVAVSSTDRQSIQASLHLAMWSETTPWVPLQTVCATRSASVSSARKRRRAIPSATVAFMNAYASSSGLPRLPGLGAFDVHQLFRSGRATRIADTAYVNQN